MGVRISWLIMVRKAVLLEKEAASEREGNEGQRKHQTGSNGNRSLETRCLVSGALGRLQVGLILVGLMESLFGLDHVGNVG